jgi:hypothetical protein
LPTCHHWFFREKIKSDTFWTGLEEYIILVGIASSRLHLSYRPAIFEEDEPLKYGLLNCREPCCGRNLNGPKSLKLQTFRKDYTFSVLCNIEIRTKNSLKDNKIFYTYTKKKQILQMKIFCDYFVIKYKNHLYYIYYEIPKDLSIVFS